MPDDDAMETATKRARPYLDNATNDFFGEMFTVEATMNTPRDNQLDEYLESPASTTDILSFWKQKEKVWPQLSYVARSLLGAPADSTSSERSFSTAGRMAEERRCQLKSSTVDGLLFLHGLSKWLMKL